MRGDLRWAVGAGLTEATPRPGRQKQTLISSTPAPPGELSEPRCKHEDTPLRPQKCVGLGRFQKRWAAQPQPTQQLEQNSWI